MHEVLVRYPDGTHFVRTYNFGGYITSSRRATARDIAQAVLRGRQIIDVDVAGYHR